MFKKILASLKSKIFLYTLLILLWIALSVLFYFYAPFIAFNDIHIFGSPFVRLAIIVVAWGIMFFSFMLKPIQALVEAFKNDKKEQLKELKQERADIVRKIKRNYFIVLNDAKKMWKNFSLKEIPLVIVIGNQSAGKSSLINYSQMEYSLSDSLEPYKKFHKSTNNFHLYISKSGALIDTEGNYFAQESFFNADNTDEIPEDDLEKNKDFLLKKSVWNDFLRFLRKKFFYSKLNGIILVVDTCSFLNNPKGYIDETILYLVKRVGECEKSLSLKLPIYIVFSKIDLLEGMSEYWSIFDESVAQKALGLSVNEQFNKQELEADFRALGQSLLYTFMSKNKSFHAIENKKTAFLFLKQFEALCALVIDFITQASAQNTAKNQSRIRGVYFTSAYQENVPRNHLLDAICEKYDLKKPPAKSATKQHKKGYFVHTLLKDIILRDSHLHSKILRSSWESLRLGAGLICLCIITYGLSAYFVHKAHKETAQSEANLYNITTLLSQARNYEKLSLNERANLMLNLKAVLKNYPHLFDRYAFMQYPFLDISYKGFLPAKDLYFTIYKDVLSDTLVKEMEQILQTNSSPEMLIETLYMYMAISSEKYLNKPLLTMWIQKNWKYFEKYKIPQDDFIAGIEDLTLVALNETSRAEILDSARMKILRIPKQQRIYTIIAFCNSLQKQEFYNLKDKMGSFFNAVFENPEYFSYVDKIYTKDGLKDFLSHLEANVQNALEIDSWSLDETSNVDQKSLTIDIIGIYLSQYKQKWQDILLSIAPKRHLTKEAILNQLQILSSPNNPVNNLAKIVSENTYLNDALLLNYAYSLGLPSTDIKSQFTAISQQFEAYYDFTRQQSFFDSQMSLVSQKAGINNQDNKAQNNNMENIANDIQEIYTKISDFTRDNTQDAKAKIAYVFEGGEKGSDENDPFKKLSMDAKLLPDSLREYYNKLSVLSWQTIETNSRALFNSVWESEVYTIFVNEISPFYPFNAHSQESLPISSFKSFFGNQGTLQSFYQQYLSKLLLKKGNAYYPNPAYKSMRLSDEFIELFNKLTQINTMFDSNNNLTLNFFMRCVDLSADFSSIDVSYDDKSLHYDHTSSQRIYIIAEQFNNSTEFKFIANDYNYNPQYKKIYDGEWGWFRFLKSIESSQNAQNSIYFEDNKRWYFDFEIEPNKSKILKTINLIPNLSLPQKIM